MPNFLEHLGRMQDMRGPAPSVPQRLAPQRLAPRRAVSPVAPARSPDQAALAQYMRPVLQYASTPPAPPPPPPVGLMNNTAPQRPPGSIPSLQEIMLSAKLGLKL